MNMNDVIINLQQQIAYIDKLNIRPTSVGTKRQRQNRRMTLVAASEIIENIQDFGGMIADHADETWAGEEIINALVHRGLYQTRKDDQ